MYMMEGQEGGGGEKGENKVVGYHFCFSSFPLHGYWSDCTSLQ